MARTSASKKTFKNMFGYSKKTVWIGLAVILVLVLGAVWYGLEMRNGDNSPYSAVYLSSGDIYFGKLSWFPKPHMENVWYLQRTTDQRNQAQVGIMPFRSAFWGPADVIALNPKEIIFTTRLRKDSQVAKVLDNPNLLNQQQVQQELPQVPSTSSTSTAK